MLRGESPPRSNPGRRLEEGSHSGGELAAIIGSHLSENRGNIRLARDTDSVENLQSLSSERDQHQAAVRLIVSAAEHTAAHKAIGVGRSGRGTHPKRGRDSTDPRVAFCSYRVKKSDLRKGEANFRQELQSQRLGHRLDIAPDIDNRMIIGLHRRTPLDTNFGKS